MSILKGIQKKFQDLLIEGSQNVGTFLLSKPNSEMNKSDFASDKDFND